MRNNMLTNLGKNQKGLESAHFNNIKKCRDLTREDKMIEDKIIPLVDEDHWLKNIDTTSWEITY